MIRNLSGPARRIGVLELPRTELNRLGTIRVGSPALAGTPAPMSPETPSNAAIWMAQVVQAQNDALTVTPGTLPFTPALPAAPSPTIGTWNSWAGPCATPGSSPAAAAAAAASPIPASTAGGSGDDGSSLSILLWLLGGAAVIVYAAKGGRN